MSFMNLKEKARSLKNKISALFLALKRKDTPIPAKIVAGLTVGYALSPIDLIPDFIPILGYLDDIIILPLLIALSIKLIPKRIMEECEDQARDMWADGKPKKWYFALPIIAIWLFIIGFIVYKIIYRHEN
jgi:uncharacterized membrane protein YkvA (DUF1232 family)